MFHGLYREHYENYLNYYNYLWIVTELQLVSMSETSGRRLHFANESISKTNFSNSKFTDLLK